MKKCEHIAQSIRQELTDGVSELPPIHKLCKRFGASAWSVRKALCVVELEGLIRREQGKPARAKDAAPGKTNGGSDSLYALLKKDILEGRMRIGEMLPKIAYYTITYKISSHTVCRTLERLSAQSLIHKENRQWIVGPDRPEAASQHDYRPGMPVRTVLLLIDEFREWLSGRRAYLADKFYSALYEELEKATVRVELALWRKPAAAGEIIGGKQMIAERIAVLGETYAGVLVASPDNVGRLSMLPSWIEWFGTFRGAVAWFDERNEGQCLLSAINALRLKKPFIRCAADEERAALCAAEFLAVQKRKNIALSFVKSTGAPDERKINMRSASLEKALQHFGLTGISFEDVPEQNARTLWQRIERFLFSGHAAENYGNTVGMRKKLAAEAVQALPRLWNLVNNRAIDAILAPSDALGARYWLACRIWGVDFPDNRPVVSLGNDRRGRHIPLTTIDFGFESLGYRAAHFFIGDLPCERYPKAIIVSEPRIISCHLPPHMFPR